MKIVISVVNNTTQAKLILRPKFAIVKIPGHLSLEMQAELRNKLIKIANMHYNTKEHLKLYYKIGTPYLFLNRRVSSSKRETIVTYKYAEL